MNYKIIIYTGHSIQRIFERGINPEDIEDSLKTGEVIEEYPDDKPYPSELILNFINGKAIHMVVSIDITSETVYLITAYYPDAGLWDETFRIRRTK